MDNRTTKYIMKLNEDIRTCKEMIDLYRKSILKSMEELQTELNESSEEGIKELQTSMQELQTSNAESITKMEELESSITSTVNELNSKVTELESSSAEALEDLNTKVATCEEAMSNSINKDVKVYVKGYVSDTDFSEPIEIGQIKTQLCNVVSVKPICDSLGGDFTTSETYTITDEIMKDGIKISFSGSYIYKYEMADSAANNTTLKVTLKNKSTAPTHPPLPSFNNKPISYDSCFEGSTLTKLNLSSWNTTNVTSINCCFKNCSSLTTLDISGWDLTNVTNFEECFCGCTSLTTIKCTQEAYNAFQLKGVLPSGSWKYSDGIASK